MKTSARQSRRVGTRASAALATMVVSLMIVMPSMTGGMQAAGGGFANGRAIAASSIGALLNADGTVNMSSGFTGAIDANGYRMEMTETGAPRFVPQASCGNPSAAWIHSSV